MQSIVVPAGVHSATVSPSAALQALLVEPPTVLSIAAAVRVCDHQSAGRASFEGRDLAGRECAIHWCALCGASAHCAPEHHPEPQDWYRPALASMVDRDALVDFEHLTFAVREIALAVAHCHEQASQSAMTLPERDMMRRTLEACALAAREVAALAITQSAERLGPAFAVLSSEAAAL